MDYLISWFSANVLDLSISVVGVVTPGFNPKSFNCTQNGSFGDKCWNQGINLSKTQYYHLFQNVLNGNDMDLELFRIKMAIGCFAVILIIILVVILRFPELSSLLQVSGNLIPF